MVFPVVMYVCENWTIKKAEHQRIDAFKMWYWRRVLRIPWTARRSNQSILKEISPEYSSEELMLKLNLQHFDYLIWRTDLFEKTLMMGKIEGGREGNNRESDGWMVSPTWWTWVWASFGSWWWTGELGVLQSMGSQRVGHNWVTELNWLSWSYCICILKIWCNELLYISSQPYILWHHIASWKLAIVGVFTP